jgi:hypothetical protein
MMTAIALLSVLGLFNVAVRDHGWFAAFLFLVIAIPCTAIVIATL